jgi:hypothetical protein
MFSMMPKWKPGRLGGKPVKGNTNLAQQVITLNYASSAKKKISVL